MTVRLLPDIESLAINYLVEHEDVRALIGGTDPDLPDENEDARVYPAIPEKDPVFGLVTCRRTGGVEVVYHHLDAARLLFHCWGPGKKGLSKADTNTLARTVRAALLDMVGSHDEGVVTFVRTTVGLQWLPDPDTLRDRYIYEASVHAHPHPGGS